MKKAKLCAIALAWTLMLTGCGKPGEGTANSGPNGGDTTASAAPSEVLDTSDVFTDRDLEVGYDESTGVSIKLKGTTAECTANEVEISGSIVTITAEGTYILSGTLDDGMIIIDTDKKEKVQLVLDGVTVHSETSAPIYILQTDKVFITLAADSVNTLSNGGTFTAMDDNNIDAVIFSKEDLTLNGDGTLKISSPGGHGIVSKDELTITSGTYEIETASHGMTGKDGIGLASATMTITAGKDGIHAENDDTTLGYVYIKSGVYTISAEGDGISASAQLQIDDGTFDIVTGGGSENGDKHTSDAWGDFMGGGMGGMGGPGGPGGGRRNAVGTAATTTDSDSTSIKGIKGGSDLSINGGTFTMNCADDAVHSNGSATISGGTFAIATGDDGFHADDTLTIAGGVISITESYEGLEGLHVQVVGGDIKLYASDDGINAAGGTDQSGTGGIRGDQFGRPGGMGGASGSSNGSIVISGGSIYVNASGDGLDANGTLAISGGYTVVCGPTTGDTATLDYDISGVITGGTFIGTGASGMAQTFSDSEQGVFAVNAGNCAAGTAVTLEDTKGNKIIDNFKPELSYNVVILSTPDMVKGQTYKITIGTASGEFEAY